MNQQPDLNRPPADAPPDVAERPYQLPPMPRELPSWSSLILGAAGLVLVAGLAGAVVVLLRVPSSVLRVWPILLLTWLPGLTSLVVVLVFLNARIGEAPGFPSSAGEWLRQQLDQLGLTHRSIVCSSSDRAATRSSWALTISMSSTTYDDRTLAGHTIAAQTLGDQLLSRRHPWLGVLAQGQHGKTCFDFAVAWLLGAVVVGAPGHGPWIELLFVVAASLWALFVVWRAASAALVLRHLRDPSTLPPAWSTDHVRRLRRNVVAKAAYLIGMLPGFLLPLGFWDQLAQRLDGGLLSAGSPLSTIGTVAAAASAFCCLGAIYVPLSTFASARARNDLAWLVSASMVFAAPWFVILVWNLPFAASSPWAVVAAVAALWLRFIPKSRLLRILLYVIAIPARLLFGLATRLLGRRTQAPWLTRLLQSWPALHPPEPAPRPKNARPEIFDRGQADLLLRSLLAVPLACLYLRSLW